MISIPFARKPLVLIMSLLSAGLVNAQENSPQIEELVVYGLRDSLTNARNMQRFSNNLKDVVASDAVGKLPDGNIAEALNRVSSVYLQPDQGEGRYVSIRGVDPILNNVTFNGQTIAVSDSDGRSGRAAPLDVLSASSVSYIEVHKVTMPNMDGQSIGGTINVRTPSAFNFDGQYMSMSAEMGSNTLGSDGDIYNYGGDWASQFGQNQEFGVYVSANYSYRDYLSHLYENPRVGTARNGIAPGRVFPDRVRFGSAVGERDRSNVTANLEYRPAGGDFSTWLRYYWTEYNDEELRPEFTIRNRGQIGAVSNEHFYWTRYRIENETRHERQERPVNQLVLGGEFQMSENWTVESNINFTDAKELNPWLNYYETETQSSNGNINNGPANNPVQFLLNDRGFATPVFNPAFTKGLTPEDMDFHTMSRFRDITSRVEEDTQTFDLNATWQGEWGGKTTEFKTGFKILQREKFVDDEDSRYPYDGDETLASAGTGDFFAQVGQGEPYGFLARGIRLPVPSPASYKSFFNANRADFSFDAAGARSNSIEDDYTLEEDVLAAYAMATVDLTPALSLVGGLRIEKTDVDVSAFGFVDSVSTVHPAGVTQIGSLPFGESDILNTSGSHSFTNVLPSVLVRYELTPDWLMRASLSTNLGRPDYPDMAPISTLAVSEDGIIPGVFYAENSIGNPNLEPFEATNFDISFDYYFPENAGAITIGGFYKRIENAIYGFNEQFDNFAFAGVTFAEYTSSTRANAEPGHIKGLEFSLQYDFLFLPEPFDGLGFSTNTALIDSEITVEQRPNEKLPFFNQADQTSNVQLYYEKYGVQVRLAYSYQSEALFDDISANRFEDIYRAPRESLDVKVSYNITDDIRVFLSGKNLNDEPDLTYRNQNTYYIAENPGYEIYGTEWRVGLNWAFR